jgi:hypothetical protein
MKDLPLRHLSKQSGEFPSLHGKYIKEQAHLKADHLFLIED